MANIGSRVLDAIRVLTGKKEAMEHGAAHAAEAVKKERTASADDVADYLAKVKEGRNTPPTAAASTPPAAPLHTTSAPPATIPGMVAHTAASFFNSFSTHTKRWIAGIALGYTAAIDNPFIEGTESAAVQAYKSIRGITQGVPTAQNDATIADARATQAGSQRNEQITQLHQRATAALSGFGQKPASSTPPSSLSVYFSNAVTSVAKDFDKGQLPGYSAQFEKIAKGVDDDRNGNLSKEEQLALANSKDFVNLMEGIPVSKANRAAITAELLPELKR